MKITGRLVLNEFADCTLPLTVVINGKKKKIGNAYIRPDGVVEATVDDEEVQQRLNSEFVGQLAIKLNPEVRLEPRPAMAKYPE